MPYRTARVPFVFPYLRGRLLSAFECEVLRLISHAHTHHTYITIGWCGSILVDDLGGCKVAAACLAQPNTSLRLFLPAILAVT